MTMIIPSSIRQGSRVKALLDVVDPALEGQEARPYMDETDPLPPTA